MGFCGLSRRVTAIFAGIFTLIQALLWCILAILALLVFSCKIQVSDSNLGAYMLYLIYMYMIIEWPEEGSSAAAGTQNWVIIYLTFSLLWAIASLLLLIAAVSEAKGRTGLNLRAPWLGLTTLFLILDVAATIVYSLDISYTEDLEELLEFVGLDVPEAVSSASSTSSIFGVFTMGPSIIATVIFSRAVLLWAANLALLIHVAQDARQQEKEAVAPAPEPRQPYQEYLKKMSTIGPIPDAKWDPYQRKRSEVPIVKPLRVPSPPNDRKRKQSDYGQYLYYARQPRQHHLDDIKSEPPTPSTVPTSTESFSRIQ